METIDLTRTVKDKVDSCPNCQFKLVQKSVHCLKCDQCGLILELTTGKERFWDIAAAIVMLVGMAAFFVGLELSKLIGHV